MTAAASEPGQPPPDRAVDLAVDPTCLFCRIVAGEVPSTEVLSTDQVYAFGDINPAAPVHVLVVPRVHIRDASAVTPADGDVLAAMFAAANEVASVTHVADSGYRFVFNVGSDAGNTVGHLHLHLLGGRHLEWPPG